MSINQHIEGFFAKLDNGFWRLSISAKSTIIIVLQGSQ